MDSQTIPSDLYFDVWISKNDYESWRYKQFPCCIALSENGHGLDGQLGSYNLPQNIIDALNRAGISGDCEMMESIWGVNDYESKTKEEIIGSMENEGFKYMSGLL